MIPVDAIARAVISIVTDPPPPEAPGWDTWLFLAVVITIVVRHLSTDHPVRP